MLKQRQSFRPFLNYLLKILTLVPGEPLEERWQHIRRLDFALARLHARQVARNATLLLQELLDDLGAGRLDVFVKKIARNCSQTLFLSK
jgi:hypothetical protein